MKDSPACSAHDRYALTRCKDTMLGIRVSALCHPRTILAADQNCSIVLAAGDWYLIELIASCVVQRSAAQRVNLPNRQPNLSGPAAVHDVRYCLHGITGKRQRAWQAWNYAQL
jgi:hypothetical protein